MLIIFLLEKFAEIYDNYFEYQTDHANGNILSDKRWYEINDEYGYASFIDDLFKIIWLEFLHV